MTIIAALGAALLTTHSALAATALGKACAADIKAQCADVKPGGGKLKDCVKAHFSDLSADCQVAIVCAPRWREALEAGCAPRVVLRATHEGALDYCSLPDLKRLAVGLA